MATPNRVEELQKRYKENGRRYFAPLANEYRKTGDVARAIVLLQKHLGENPQNLNGLVVYGQCLFEMGKADEARQPFEMALALDPENLIALRHLGDIARAAGDAPGARGWYAKLLELDRRNDEVLEIMKELGGGEEAKPAAPSQAPSIVSVAGSVSVANPMDSIGMVDLVPPTAETPVPAPPRRPTPPPARPATPPRPKTPVDHSAKTIEVSAQPKPEKRSSLLDVSFDFGELGVDAAPPPPPPPPPPEPLLPSEAVEYGFAQVDETPSAESVLDDLLPSAEPAPPEPVLGMPAGQIETASLIEEAPAGEALSGLPPIEGLEAAEFSAEVSPLAGLESSEFEGGEAAPMDGLESDDFVPPTAPTKSLEELDTVEFVPPTLASLTGEQPVSVEPIIDTPPEEVEEDDSFVESGLDDLSTTRRSVAGLPLLEPLGTPTPAATPSVDDLPLLPSMDEAETMKVDAAEVRKRVETPATFVTETMAQVYIQQGHTERAIEVYRQLIAQSPADEGLRARLRALESPPAPVAARAPTPAAATPVVEMPSVPDPRASLGFDTPLGGTEPVDEPAPANAMLTDMSFAGVSLATPNPARPSAPAQAPATGPSAREFFGRFAQRTATPNTTRAVSTTPLAGSPMVGGALMSPLDDLFGVAVASEDEAAAHRLAGIGATSGPSGGSALDSLFGEGPSAPMPSTTPARGTVPRASDKLRFDQFFTPPAGEAPSAPAPMDEPGSGPSALPSDDDTPGDDDLDQFHGWLKGLTQ